jgi:hypothetical protein
VQLFSQEQLQIEVIFLDRAWFWVEGVNTLALLVDLQQISHYFALS